MEPIINPSLIYLMRVVGNLHSMCLFLVFPLIVVIILLGIATVCEEEDKRLQRYFVKACYVLVVLGLISILIPSHDTLLQMVITSYITPDNFNAIRSEVIQLIIDIKNALK